MMRNIAATVDVLNTSFAETYATTTRPQLDVTIADFTNTSPGRDAGARRGWKKSTRLWVH